MFLLTSQSTNNILLYNLANLRLRQRSSSAIGTTNEAAAEQVHQKQMRRTYSRVFGSIGTAGKELSSAQIGHITKVALFLHPLPKADLHSALLQPIRQFHTRPRKVYAFEERNQHKKMGGTGDGEEGSGWDFFRLMKSRQPEKLPSYEDYRAEVQKMDESARRAYNEGFIRAVFVGEGAKRGGTVAVDENIWMRFWRPFRRLLIISSVLFIAIQGSLFVVKKMLGGDIVLDFANRSMSFGMETEVNVTFEDVCGADEAKLEVQEVVDYLRDPERYTRLGARLPKGVLLVGPPGTGKTLLARAIAGEASVPFFHTSGSEFDEVLVGQGAKRVRELFKKAKKHAPCVVFIDEIDSVGAKRTSSSLHPYANQTINQLLSEMDGFVQNEGVIVIGATNKKEHLDSALLRPGRFDVEVQVPIPDLAGRSEIFQLYLGKIVHDELCDPLKLARGTYGFTGAGIENMVNQAALKAASEGRKKVTMWHLDEARDRLLMGPARLKGRFPDEEANKNTAFHEAGHAIVAMFTKNANPLHKVTIIPRGGSLGHTSQLPVKDHLQKSKAQLLADLDVSMGGRVAEELIFGEDNVTTGASSDLKHATALAESMVKMFGMSGRVGLRDFTTPMEEHELGAFGRGPQTSNEIDSEIRRVLQESYERAKELLIKYKVEHQLLAEALLEYETLNKQEVERVIRGERLNLKKLSMVGQQQQQIKSTGQKRKQPKQQPPVPTTFIADRASGAE